MTIKIIIADDHQLFIDGIKSILSTELGITFIGQAKDGLELINLVEKGDEKPDVILTDIRMPVMDGIVATRVLSKKYPKIPILALSMFDQEADVIDMLDAGVSGYIVKNAGKEEMLEAIYTLHRKKQYFSKELKGRLFHYQKDKGEKKKLLTRREKEIVSLIAKGRTSLQISQELNISKLTVDTHRKNIHKKLRIISNAGLVRYALEEKLT